MPTFAIASTRLDISQVHSNPDQARKVFDPQAMAELKISLQEGGLICPIAVVERAPGDYLIIAGERRFRAACELGWHQIDARIWPKETSPQEIELLSLMENVQRKDLNPIEIAQGYRLLSELPYRMTQEEIARHLGISDRTRVTRMLDLLSQPQEIQDFVVQTTLSPTHVKVLARLEDEKERIKMAQLAAREEWSVKETTKRVNRHLAKPAISTPAPIPTIPVGAPAAVEDPLALVWPELESDAPSYSLLTWKADYLGSWQWRFETSFQRYLQGSLGRLQNVPPELRLQVEQDLRRIMSEWFLNVGEKLAAQTSDTAV